jgi:hypothetical protein
MRVATVLSAPAVVLALMASSESAFAQSPANATFLQCDKPESRKQCAKIDIEAGHTRVMTFARPFKEVTLGDPDIADVQVKSDRMLLINAKQKVGTTSLILFDDAGPIHSAEIVVRPQPDAPELFGRVKIYGARQGRDSSVHDYFPYACTSTGCTRLKEEYRGEHSKDIFVPGQAAEETSKSGLPLTIPVSPPE